MISIHAAREGGDSRSIGTVQVLPLFQSTPPVKAATLAAYGIRTDAHNFNPRRP